MLDLEVQVLSPIVWKDTNTMDGAYGSGGGNGGS